MTLPLVFKKDFFRGKCNNTSGRWSVKQRKAQSVACLASTSSPHAATPFKHSVVDASLHHDIMASWQEIN